MGREGGHVRLVSACVAEGALRMRVWEAVRMIASRNRSADSNTSPSAHGLGLEKSSAEEKRATGEIHCWIWHSAWTMAGYRRMPWDGAL